MGQGYGDWATGGPIQKFDGVNDGDTGAPADLYGATDITGGDNVGI